MDPWCSPPKTFSAQPPRLWERAPTELYKATLEGGHHIAVKQLREKIAKGQKEFESEVNLIGKIRYPNLLALRAYYLGPKGKKILVFDYMPKGSLATFLHQEDWRRQQTGRRE
ncbi:hypothetical protein ZOSMA_67G00690 [Zostera marina]|uniref:Protein kinase domain-containing protein n=1 Tax=Zostera marina TaxID=29655 RepID=A0A0K9NUE2_ZOSMR|nr:hypothetical protein ZOSMA_67G00690 [Zostera marina]